MVSISGDLSFASWNGDGRFHSDPADHPESVEVHKVVTGVPAVVVETVVDP